MESQIEIKSPAKKALVEFVTKAKDDEDYPIALKGYTSKEATAFLQQMRVELSRLRGVLRRRGKTVRQFKMLLINSHPLIEPGPDKEDKVVGTILVLRISMRGYAKIEENISDVFNKLEKK